MPKRSKLNLERIRESLNTPCPYCDYSIPPSEIRRVDTENMICPKCSSIFNAAKKAS